MATHSSVLAWRIPGTGESRGLLSMRSHRVRHDWSDLAVAAAGHIKYNFQSIYFRATLSCSSYLLKFRLSWKCMNIDIFTLIFFLCHSPKSSPPPHRVQKTVLYICVSFAVLHTGLSLPSLFVCLFVCFKFYFIFKLYIIVLVLPNIKMNPPIFLNSIYMC